MGEIVYLGRDNTFELKLLEKRPGANPEALTQDQMEAITRIDLIYSGTTISSQTNSSAFDWSTRQTEGVVIFALGGLDIPVGSDLAVELIVYDAEHPNGILWGSFSLKVEQK
jgi:hypothetical protein